eukprot:scaffold184507_cov35-Prasinocladus_malaysianus.AAC.1
MILLAAVRNGLSGSCASSKCQKRNQFESRKSMSEEEAKAAQHLAHAAEMEVGAGCARYPHC